ncbi:hypothetical protein [Desulfatitalea alkaliphila]|uniref:Pyridine nucleotide-disulphide oxidoreductase n=1 Tax=Desulfatitalea alkaliphila TaxID=2929485 RepID=A0AA41R652_9BACT|nr:hypothetical protein [Desulfatitalea alkaliphila]MCJ8501845.1 hypothetical protein [Desulfatitalea alkaliphila]
MATIHHVIIGNGIAGISAAETIRTYDPDSDISDLPLAGAAPEWYSEKAVAIGAYFVASGAYTVLGPMPPITGSMDVVHLLTQGLKAVVGATFAVEPDPEKAAVLIRNRIEAKRKGLGL